MRRLLLPLLLFGALTCAAGGAFASGDELARKPPSIQARAFLLVDGRSGAVLAAKGADTPLPIASITKLMTARVALQRLAPADIVRASKSAAAVGESSIGLVPGQRLSVHDLLEGALVQSANDAAMALADAAGDGDRAEFVAAMNAEADALGLAHTHFVRPDGLDVAGHVSTARDVTRLARITMRSPLVRSIVKQRTARISTGQTLRTWNDMLGTFRGVFGVKTGHTSAAGWCQVVAARWQGVTLYATILGSPTRGQRDADLAELLRYGFSFYGQASVVHTGHVYATVETEFGHAPVELVAARSVSRIVRVDRPLTERIVAQRVVTLPVRKGQPLGRIIVRSGGARLAEVPLIAATATARPNILGRVRWYTARALSNLSPF